MNRSSVVFTNTNYFCLSTCLLLSMGCYLFILSDKKRTKLYKKCQQRLLVSVDENKEGRIKETEKWAVKNMFLLTEDYVKHKAENEN